MNKNQNHSTEGQKISENQKITEDELKRVNGGTEELTPEELAQVSGGAVKKGSTVPW